MKLLVLCDKKGEIQSVVIPNPKFADRINVELEGGGTVHRLDIDKKIATHDILLGKKGEDARSQAYGRLRSLIPRR